MKKILPIIIGVIIIGGGSFYAGMKYGQSKTTSSFPQGPGAFANLSTEERQARFSQMGGANADGEPRGMRAGGGFTSGEILAKDDTSITVKLQDGGSKIIFLSDTARVSKTAEGSASDLAVGTQVSVTGTANSDGSISAQTIQIRPDTPPVQ